MCGRFTFSVNLKEVKERFDIGKATIEKVESSYNIAPSQQVLAIIDDGQVNRLGTLRWGLIPFWAKEEKIGNKLINARAETITEKNSFKHAFKKRRCVIPADGFYEWKKENGKKQPYRIHIKEEKIFGFAGLWEKWVNAQGESIYSCTIITTNANERMSGIHHRMPVILTKEKEKDWLDPANHNTEALKQMLHPLPSGAIDAYKVSTEINNPKNNYASLQNSL